MGRSLSLAAYRALSRRKPQSAHDSKVVRPAGELIWAHATNAARFSVLCDLGARLKVLRPGLSFLLTIPEGRFEPPTESNQSHDWVLQLGADHPAAMRQFLAHWRPDLFLWSGGDFMPNAISTASENDVPMILIDIGVEDLPNRRPKWFPDLTRSTLECFDTILANSESTAYLLRRSGIAAERIRVSALLRTSATPPSCDLDELTEVTRDLAGRPVWLAAYVQASEFDPILTAHRTALRLAHRLLLVISVADTQELDQLSDALAGSDLRFTEWELGDPVEDFMQVLISRNPEALGLWYRVAPLTFLASSLSTGASGVSPLEAAALGSAVLYGPYVPDHLEAYARLAAAGAARSVRDGEGLGAAVIQLIAPDHAAAMALAGWQVVTEGAPATDQLLDLIQDMLDLHEASDAGP